MVERRCWGRTRKFVRCGRIGDWLFLCDEHRLQPYLWVATGAFVVAFTVIPGWPALKSLLFPQEAVQDRAYRELNKATIRFSSTLRDVMLAGADEWLPKNREEFFSERGVEVFCRHINAESAFGVQGESIGKYVGIGAREYLTELKGILNSAQNSIDSGTYRAASVVESAVLLNMIAQKAQAPLRFRENYAPLLCFGTEDRAREFFANVQSFIDVLLLHAASIPKSEQEWWRLFPDYPATAGRGNNHFSEADLQQWLLAHPGRDGKILALPRDPR